MALKYNRRVKESAVSPDAALLFPDRMVDLMAQRLEKVDRLLGFLEENLDEKHCVEVLQRHMDAISGISGRETPLSVYCKADHELYPITEAYNDPEKMLYNELVQAGEFGSVLNSAIMKDDYPFQIRSNHGVVIMHNLVGGPYTLREGSTPWADRAGSISEYRREWEDKQYDPYAGVPGKVIETYRYYAERLSEYPLCRKFIRLCLPDMQGPFSIAASLLGNDIFYDIYDNPDDIHWLLDRITSAYIEFYKIIAPLVNGFTPDGNGTYAMGAIFPGLVLLKEDTSSACLSDEQITEFCTPYNRRITDELGPVSIHYCGRSLPFHHTVYKIPKLRGINFGDPDKQDMADVFRNWRDSGVAVINWGYHQPHEFLYKTLAGADTTGFTLCCSASGTEEGRDLVKRYREEGISALQ